MPPSADLLFWMLTMAFLLWFFLWIHVRYPLQLLVLIELWWLLAHSTS
jgi:hypothetical protein